MKNNIPAGNFNNHLYGEAAPVSSISKRNQLREELKRKTQEFLANGGKIQVLASSGLARNNRAMFNRGRF